MPSLTWLHISDIHFNPANDWKDSTARQALLTHLQRELARLDLRPDLVFCTGDIAYGAIPSQAKQTLAKQYGMAQKFFDELLQVCGRDGQALSRGRLFVVPGNHDVDRNAVLPSAQESWVRWGSGEQARNKEGEINRQFSGPSADVKEALKRLAAYRRFAAKYLPHQAPPAGHLHYAHSAEIDGLKVGIAGFNSAWTCYDDKDDRTIWLAAEAQFNHMREQLGGAELRIGLIHHPADWFNVADREFANARCKNDFDFWLHGHTHDLGLNDARTHVTLGAGAITGTAPAEFGYNLVRIDLENADAHAWRYAYQPLKGRWDIYCEAGVGEAGRVPFRLPDRLAASSGKPPAPAAPLPPRLRSDHPFPPSAACLCRGQELSCVRTAAQATPPAPILVHGFGGLGKTEVAIHYLLSPEAREHFGFQRYFVSVEGLEKTAREDLPQQFWTLLSTALFAPEARPPARREAVLAALGSALRALGRPVLLVLDNFETPVLVDKDFAIATLDALAGLAEHGLALLVTLRDPLPKSRGNYRDLPLRAFADDSAARAVFLHWAGMSETILNAGQQAALDQLLNLAEGWPIQLQMLGVLAGEEGLEALARRCPDPASLGRIAADHDESDPHRHPHLSCALTYDAPQLGDAARSLLRALAFFPAGVPEDWLPCWPEEEAVRQVNRFKLLAESQGIQGESRRRLLPPMRGYLAQEHEVDRQDQYCLLAAWLQWWQAKMPELFDEKLPRQAPGVYRDMHDRELASIVSLTIARVGKQGSTARNFNQALRNLENWVGDVEDWQSQNAELYEAVRRSRLFADSDEAEEFAQLLAGSQSLNTRLKAKVVESLRQDGLKRPKIDGLFWVFRIEVDAWAWQFASHDLAWRLSRRLAGGRICLESPLPVLLQSLTACLEADERIALLVVTTFGHHWSRPDHVELQAVLKRECAAAGDSALAHFALVECNLAQDRLGELKHAVAINPDYGRCWHLIAEHASDPEDTRNAWREVVRCTDLHLAECARLGMEVSIGTEGAFAAKHDALLALHDADRALTTLDEWASRTTQSHPDHDQLELARRYAQAGQFAQAAHWLTLTAQQLNPEKIPLARCLATHLRQEIPQEILPILFQIHLQYEAPVELVITASLLFGLGLPTAAIPFARLAAHHPDLGAEEANELAYRLLTGGDEAAATLDLAYALAQHAFRSQQNSAVAETLLCAGMRQEADDTEIRPALNLLLGFPAAADEEDRRNLAGLFFDARRYDALPRLRAWLAACPREQQDSPAWQALDALVQSREAPAESPAAALLAALRSSLAEIEQALADEQSWRARHADVLLEIAEQAESWLAALKAAGRLPETEESTV